MNKQIEELYHKLDAQDKIINTQALEIARLKEQLEYLRSNEYLNQVKWERTFNEELVKDLQQKIDKSIEYIIENSVLSDEWYEKEFCKFIPTGNITYRQLTPKKVKKLLEILGEKENE